MANAEFAQSGAAEVRFDGVCKSYGVNRVLRGLNFTLEAGGVYCLMAPSGSGKTTLFRAQGGHHRFLACCMAAARHGYR